MSKQLAIILQGGLVQSVVCDHPDIELSVAVVDYDVSDCSDDHGLTDIEQGDGTSTKAYIGYIEVTEPAINLDQVFNNE